MSKSENASITSTFFGVEDHGILTFSITLEGDGWGQSFGGIALDSWNDQKNKRSEGFAPGLILMRDIISAVGATSWETLTGKYCRVERESGMISSLGHPVKNKWVRLSDYIPERNHD